MVFYLCPCVLKIALNPYLTFQMIIFRQGNIYSF